MGEEKMNEVTRVASPNEGERKGRLKGTIHEINLLVQCLSLWSWDAKQLPKQNPGRKVNERQYSLRDHGS